MEKLAITLRNFEESDVDDFMEWARDEEVYRFSMRETFKSREEVDIYIKKEAMENPWWKAICVEGRPVGAINLQRGLGDSTCRAEIGYGLARKWWGNGVATEAVKLCVSRGFTDMPGLERIEGLVEPETWRLRECWRNLDFSRKDCSANIIPSRGKPGTFIATAFFLHNVCR